MRILFLMLVVLSFSALATQAVSENSSFVVMPAPVNMPDTTEQRIPEGYYVDGELPFTPDDRSPAPIGEPGVSEGYSPDYTGNDTNTPNMATPTCVTYPEWTGLNINDVDKSVLQGRTYRILNPEISGTMDYVPNRLNIFTDLDGTIIRQDCG